MRAYASAYRDYVLAQPRHVPLSTLPRHSLRLLSLSPLAYALIQLRVILSFSSAATVATICAIVHVNIGLAYNCKRDTSKCPFVNLGDRWCPPDCCGCGGIGWLGGGFYIGRMLSLHYLDGFLHYNQANY